MIQVINESSLNKEYPFHFLLFATVLLRDNVANEPLSLLVSHLNLQTTRESKRTELTPL